jgi:ribosomal protein L32
MEVLGFIGMVFLAGCFAGSAAFLLRFTAERLEGWQEKSKHKCGHLDYMSHRVCPKCGNRTTEAEYQRMIVRKTLCGWEYK